MGRVEHKRWFMGTLSSEISSENITMIKESASNMQKKWKAFLSICKEKMKTNVLKVITKRRRNNDQYDRCEIARRERENAWNRWRRKNTQELWQNYTVLPTDAHFRTSNSCWHTLSHWKHAPYPMSWWGVVVSVEPQHKQPVEGVHAKEIPHHTYPACMFQFLVVFKQFLRL